MPFSVSDTIVAAATPPGRGGIGVVRLSGPDAHRIALSLIARQRALEPRRATFARIARTDQVVATYFPAPHSYTGEDVVELSAHGSPVVLRAIIVSAIDDGARLAEPGEFTLRAFLNGRIDLPQAEAVADLIEAVTPLQARAAFDQLQGTLTQAIGELDRELFDLMARLEASIDFPEEGYHFIDRDVLVRTLDCLSGRMAVLLARARQGRLVRDGLHVALIGPPNAGKSSLFNALAGASRAIVTDVPGTTRDLLTETVDLNGLRATLIDTAGWRDLDCEDVGPIEAEGVARARRAAEVADLAIVVLDRTRPLDDQPGMLQHRNAEPAGSRSLDPAAPAAAPREDARNSGPGGGRTGGDSRRTIVVANKIDLPPAWCPDELGRRLELRAGGREEILEVSARTGSGLDELRERIGSALDVEPMSDCPEITNVRHIALVQRAQEALQRARAAAGCGGVASDRGGPSGAGAFPEEFVLADLQEARAALEEITGKRTPEDVLGHIFSRFCVGK